MQTQLKSSFVSFLTLTEKEVLRFLVVWSQTLISPLINSSLYIVVFGVSLSALLPAQNGFSYLEFLIPGLIAMSALNNSMQNSSSSIIISKFHNDLQDLKMIPLGPAWIAMAYATAGWIRGLACAMLVLFMGQFFLFFRTGHLLGLSHPLAFVIFLSLGCVIFASLGTIAGFRAASFDQINAISQFIVLPLIYLGGVFYSLNVLHPFWQSVAQFNPMVYMINGIRWSILGVSDISIVRCMGLTVGFSVFTFFLAWRAVKTGNYFRF